MRTIRGFEEKLVELVTAGKLAGFLHLYAGEEAVAVGVCAHLARPRRRRLDAPRSRPLHRQGRRRARHDGRAVRPHAPASARARAARCTSPTSNRACSAPTASSAAASRSPPARRSLPSVQEDRRCRGRVLRRRRDQPGRVPRGAEHRGDLEAAGDLRLREQRLRRGDADRVRHARSATSPSARRPTPCTA